MTEQELLARGDMLVAYLHGAQVDQAPIVEPEVMVQWASRNVEQEGQESVPKYNRECQPCWPVARSEVYTNSNLAKKAVDAREAIRTRQTYG